MELELGLKITKTKDDIDSISEYQFMKDAGPVFHSRETNTVFILTANLKGYKRNNIDIKISKDGSKISINGKKPIQETVMMGWVMQRKVVDVIRFNKDFKIPRGVNLNKIKANYNEEEWMLNIVMPKLVKGICGLKIEEFKEQEKGEIDHVSSSVGETSEIDHVSSIVGETSQKGSNGCEFQDREGSENVIEKMFDDTKKEANKEIITQKEVRGSKLRIEDGNDEVNRNIRENEKCKLRIEDSKIKDIRERDGKETYEALKTLENMERILNETDKDINEEPIEKEVGDYKLRIENGNGEIVRQKGGKEEYELTKKSERDQGVGVLISNQIEDTSKGKEFEDQKMDGRSTKNRHDDVNRDIIGGTINEEEKEESILRSEDSKVKDIDKGISHNIVDTSQRVFEECVIQQSGESNQRESKEHFKESEKENSLEPVEAMKVLEVEQNVVGHIPSNIGCINQNEFEESRIPQMEKTTITKGKMNGGEYEKLPSEYNQDFQKEMIKPMMKTKDGDQECILEKLGDKEGFDNEMMIIKKEFPNHLPKSSSNKSGGLNVEKTQETKYVNGEMVTKEVEYFSNKSEGDIIERRHLEAKKGNNTKETMPEEIEESENVLKESGQEQFLGVEGSKEFNFENKDEQNDATKEALVENESLIVEGGEYKERTKEIHQDVEDTIEYGIVKLKGEGSLKMDENRLKESGHEKVAGIEGSKRFNFANEEQNEVINDALVEDESLIIEVGEYKEKTKEIVQDEEDKNKHGIVKLKGEGSANIHDEPNEFFEGENVNSGIFDGRKTQREIKQTEDEDKYVNEEGANIEKSMKKVNRDKYEKLQNEENEGFHKNITKNKDEEFLQEETRKGISKASNAAKVVFPMKMFDSPIDTIEEPKNTRIEKIKGVKETSMEPFEAMSVSKLDPFEANDDERKNFIKPMRENKDDEPNGKKPNKEGFDEKRTINEEFPKNIPKSTREESEGLNVLKMQETKDVKENVVKRKGKEIEYFKENCEGDRLQCIDVEATKVNNIRETLQEKIENSENGIKGGGQQEVAKIEGSKRFNVAKEEEEESKKRSKSKEQDEESISHNIVDSGQRVFEEALIQQSGESKQKEIGGSKCDYKESFEVLKESSMEQNVVDHIHSQIGSINKNEFREPRVPQMEKTKSTEGKKNGRMYSEKTPFEANEDVQKAMFGDVIQKEVVKINEEFPKHLPKSSFDESEGLNVQKIQESKNVKQEMVDKDIEYFEKGESGRFKRMHVITKKENTKETMHEEIEKNENEVKESGQQHAKENTIKEMDEVSENVTGELKQKVAEIDESKGFNVAKEEVQKDITRKALVESESLMEKIEGKEYKEKIKAKRVHAEDGEIEFGIVKLKGKGPTKIHAAGRNFQEKDESKDVNKKGEKTEKFGKKVNNKIQNEEDEDFKKVVTKGKDECYLPDNVSERRSQDTKDAKEDFPMKMLDSHIDTRDELKDKNIEKRKGLKENEKVVPFVKKVKLEEEFKERTKAKVKDEEDKIEYGIVKLKGEGSTKIRHKFQDKEEIEDVNEKEFVKKVNEKIQNQDMKKTQDAKKKVANSEKTMKKMNGNKYENIQNEENEGFKKKIAKEKCECYLEGETSKGRSEESMDAKEDIFRMMLDSPVESEEGLKGRKIKKTEGVKEEFEKVEQMKANEGLRNDIEEQNFGESITKEELQESEIERIRTSEREIQSVVCVGFKEFDYENAKDKKEKIKVLLERIESKKLHESKDESMNQDIFSPKNPEDKGDFHNGEKARETMQEKKKIDDREQENVARDDGKVETKEKYIFKEYKSTQNINDEKFKIQDEITKSSIENEKEDESLDESLKNEIEAPKTVTYEGAKPSKLKMPRFNQQSTNEIKRKSECVIEEHEATKDSQKLNSIDTEKIDILQPQFLDVKEKVLKKREVPKIAKSEEAKNASKLKRESGKKTQSTEEMKHKVKEIASQFDKASGSKSVAEKVHETLKRERERKSEESTSKMDVQDSTKSKTGQFVEQCINKDEEAKHGIKEHKEVKDETSGRKKDNTKTSKTVEEENVLKKREEPKVAKSEEKKKPKMKETTPQFDLASGTKRVAEKVHEHQRHEESISNEDEEQAKAIHAKEKVVQQSKVSSSLCTRQLEVGEEEKTKKKEVEQCINKDEEEKLGIEEIEEEKHNEKVYEEQKEDKDETCGGKKDSAKISNKLFVPLVIAGSALIASIVFVFVKHRRSRKM